MSGKWISVVDAIGRLAKTKKVEHGVALRALVELAKNEIVAARIENVYTVGNNEPRQNVRMSKADWAELFRLGNNQWFTDGVAYFSDDDVWEGIQVRVDQLEQQVGKLQLEGDMSWTEEFRSKNSYVTLSEALSWIAFGELKTKVQLDLLLSSPKGIDAERKLVDATRRISEYASAGKIKVRGRYVMNYSDPTAAEEVERKRLPKEPLRAFARFECLHGGLVRGNGIIREAEVPDNATQQPDDGWHDVIVSRAELRTVFPPVEDVKVPKVPANRKLDYDAIRASAQSMREKQPSISIGSAADSIVADLPPNPKSGKQRDRRHIEKIIAPLWEGGNA